MQAHASQSFASHRVIPSPLPSLAKYVLCNAMTFTDRSFAGGAGTDRIAAALNGFCLCSVHQYALGTVVPGPASLWDTHQQPIQHGRLSKLPMYRCDTIGMLAFISTSQLGSTQD